MWCPNELKLNKFVHEHIPSNAEYFRRNGEVAPPPGLADAVPPLRNCVGEQLKDMAQWAKSEQAREEAIKAEEERKKAEEQDFPDE